MANESKTEARTLSPIDAAMASVPEANPYRARNRRTNVLKLAGVIDNLLGAISIEPEDARVVGTVENFTESEWMEAAKRADLACYRDGKAPSAETRKVLVAFYAERRKDALAQEQQAALAREAEEAERDIRNDDDFSDYGAMVEQAGA